MSSMKVSCGLLLYCDAIFSKKSTRARLLIVSDTDPQSISEKVEHVVQAPGLISYIYTLHFFCGFESDIVPPTCLIMRSISGSIMAD